MKTPSWREFLLYWAKFGFLSFGGPAAQIGMLHRDLVERHKWLDDEEFNRALGFVSILPGPEAHQLATYIGRKQYGVKGGIVAGGLFLLPSLFIISGITWLYLQFSVTANLDLILDGLRTGVLALILYTIYRMQIKVTWGFTNITIAIVFIVLGVVLDLPIMLLVLLGLVIGYILSLNIANSDALKVNWLQTTKPLFIGLVLWSVSFMLTYQFEPLRQIAILFTQAALITFGGAYSVIPFVADAAVNHYGWLSQSQMLDGIALGESTPGPLIMINAFVGFIAYQGFLGALVATWFTFLPSFILVFAGAPLMQAISTHQRIQAILSKITIVVITFLAGFAISIGQSLDPATSALQIVLAIGAFLLLMRTKIPVISLLGIVTTSYWVIITLTT